MLGSSPAGIIRPLDLMVRIAASQAADVEFESHRGHCGYSITVVYQIVALKILGSVSVSLRSAQSNSPLDCLRPGGHIWAGRIAAIAAGLHSVSVGSKPTSTGRCEPVNPPTTVYVGSSPTLPTYLFACPRCQT